MKIRIAGVAVAGALAALCACSTDPSPAPSPHATTHGAVAGSGAAAGTGAAAPDACSIVTPADIALATGIHVAAGAAIDSYLRGTSCEFRSASDDVVIVQTSPKPDDYLQESKFEAMYDGIHGLEAQADRGFVATPNPVGVGHVLVVKHGWGVDVSLASKSGYGVGQEQALATVIAARL